MRVRFAVLCDFSNDTADGKLNLYGITEAVFAPQFPAVHKQCHLVVSYQVEPEDFGQVRAVKVQFIDMDGRPLIELEHMLTCPDRLSIINHRHILHDVQIPSAGNYQFTFLIDGREVGNRALEAVQVKEEPKST